MGLIHDVDANILLPQASEVLERIGQLENNHDCLK